MEFNIRCPWCNQEYSVDDSFIGQNVECSVCGKQFEVNNPHDSTPTKEKTTEYSSNKTQPGKNAFASKNIIRKVIIGCAVLIIIAVSICVVCYVRCIPEKEYKKGLKAYNEQCYEEAVEFFQKAADYGHKKAKDEQQKALAEINYKNGLKAFDSHRYEDAVGFFQKVAEYGKPEAQLILGLCYFNGDGIKKDEDEAIKWIRRAAEQNNQEAEFKLGLCYLAGIGVNRREEEAVYWFQRAAEQGHIDAMTELANCYHEGKGVRKDIEKSREWRNKAQKAILERGKRIMDAIRK